MYLLSIPCNVQVSTVGFSKAVFPRLSLPLGLLSPGLGWSPGVMWHTKRRGGFLPCRRCSRCGAAFSCGWFWRPGGRTCMFSHENHPSAVVGCFLSSSDLGVGSMAAGERGTPCRQHPLCPQPCLGSGGSNHIKVLQTHVPQRSWRAAGVLMALFSAVLVTGRNCVL